ncbi:hypothetical protein ACEQ8H_008154 [Pleosporales sp. CAS-2024a]
MPPHPHSRDASPGLRSTPLCAPRAATASASASASAAAAARTAMAAMSDMQRSFTFLRDSIPQWQHDLTALQAKATAMQEALRKAPEPTCAPARQTLGSNESIRQGRVGAMLAEATPSHVPHTDASGPGKRQSNSLLSGRASGPARQRSRTMVIVSYDGDMQKSFELLVRAIGIGRNMLRKAKMEAKMNELAALAPSSDDDDDDGDDDDGDDDDTDDAPTDAVMAKASYQLRTPPLRAHAAAQRRHAPTSTTASATPVALFDTTDKTLENAQSLCEKAAHITLRDGDCRKELHSMLQKFSDVLKIAESEVAKYHPAVVAGPPELQPHAISDSSVSSLEEPSYKKHFPQLSLAVPEQQPIKLPSPSAAAFSSLAPKIMDIEVDDDDESEEPNFAMPPVRLTSRLVTRT